jgi:hypothetical protein
MLTNLKLKIEADPAVVRLRSREVPQSTGLTHRRKFHRQVHNQRKPHPVLSPSETPTSSISQWLQKQKKVSNIPLCILPHFLIHSRFEGGQGCRQEGQGQRRVKGRTQRRMISFTMRRSARVAEAYSNRSIRTK